jgi:hypothetical protein
MSLLGIGQKHLPFALWASPEDSSYPATCSSDEGRERKDRIYCNQISKVKISLNLPYSVHLKAIIRNGPRPVGLGGGVCVGGEMGQKHWEMKTMDFCLGFCPAAVDLEGTLKFYIPEIVLGDASAAHQESHLEKSGSPHLPPVPSFLSSSMTILSPS